MSIDTILLALIAAILVTLSLWVITVTIAIDRNVAWLRVTLDHIHDYCLTEFEDEFDFDNTDYKDEREMAEWN